MRRFFVQDIKEDSETVSIRGDEFRHLTRVLRLGAGSRVVLFNGRGLELLARIESVSKTSATARIEGRLEGRAESPLGLTLVQGLVKGGKPELIIQKATELGVKGIFFYSTSRSVPRIDGKRLVERIERWRRVAVEAAKQCRRSIVPEVGGVRGLEETLSSAGGTLRLMLYEGEDAAPIGDVIRENRHGKDAVICAGPEGGLSREDVATGRRHGFRAVSLGPRILRAETASIAAVSIVQYELGDMG